MRTLVDTRMTTSLPEGFFPARVTIQEADGTPVAGLVDLPCAEGPGIRPGERRTGAMTIMSRERILQLTGYFSQIEEHMRALVGGVAYDILAVEHSASGHMTRLQVEAVAA